MFLCWGIRDVRAIDNRPGHFLRNGQDGNMQRRLYNNFGLTQHLGIPPKARPRSRSFFFVRAAHSFPFSSRAALARNRPREC